MSGNFAGVGARFGRSVRLQARQMTISEQRYAKTGLLDRFIDVCP